MIILATCFNRMVSSWS